MSKHAPISRIPLSYRAAGVDIDAGNALVERIKPQVKRSQRAEVMGGLGGFGALFDLSGKYREPVLVSGTDGVGTKLKLAQQLNRHESIGIDLVAMCANDVLVQGAEPLFFLDYFATGKLDVDTAATVVSGIAEGCVQAGCALIGGETAEMPDMYPVGEYDLAGFCVAAVEKSQLLDGSTVQAGDVLIGLASSGAHANGYSLIRRIYERAGNPATFILADGSVLADVLLSPTRLYVKPVLSLLAEHRAAIHGMAHITGGGLSENIIRVVPEGLGLRINPATWPLPPLFAWLQHEGHLPDSEMWRTFNCGIGFVLIIASEQVTTISAALDNLNLPHWQIGQVVPADATPRAWSFNVAKIPTARIAILASGRGSNLQCLLDGINAGQLAARVVGVFSDQPKAAALKRVAAPLRWAQSPSQCADRAAFDAVLAKAVAACKPDWIICAGYMRILGEAFVNRFSGQLINIHPSLLPRYKGLNTHARVLASGDRWHGASVHFVVPELDSGAVIAQARVWIKPEDNADTLAARVLAVEHRLLLTSVQLLISGRICEREGHVWLDGQRLARPLYLNAERKLTA